MTPEADIFKDRTGTVTEYESVDPGKTALNERKLGFLTALREGKTVITLTSQDSPKITLVVLDPKEEKPTF